MVVVEEGEDEDEGREEMMARWRGVRPRWSRARGLALIRRRRCSMLVLPLSAARWRAVLPLLLLLLEGSGADSSLEGGVGVSWGVVWRTL